MKLIPNHASPARNVGARGFTLVEMLLVLTILSILAAIVYPRIMNRHTEAQKAAAVVQTKALDNAIELFQLDNGRFPTGRNPLQELVVKPSGAPNWHGPYLEQVPQDPWGHDYVYVFPGKHRADAYDLSSAGPDGQLGTADDINNWPAPQAAK